LGSRSSVGFIGIGPEGIKMAGQRTVVQRDGIGDFGCYIYGAYIDTVKNNIAAKVWGRCRRNGYQNQGIACRPAYIGIGYRRQVDIVLYTAGEKEKKDKTHKKKLVHSPSFLFLTGALFGRFT
jgi:hypothetical protein